MSRVCTHNHMIIIPLKNIERHTTYTIVSWPNPKQWVIVHTSDLMMIIRQSMYILFIITKEMRKLKTRSPTYCIMDNWENMLNLTHSTNYIWYTVQPFQRCTKKNFVLYIILHRPWVLLIHIEHDDIMRGYIYPFAGLLHRQYIKRNSHAEHWRVFVVYLGEISNKRLSGRCSKTLILRYPYRKMQTLWWLSDRTSVGTILTSSYLSIDFYRRFGIRCDKF